MKKYVLFLPLFFYLNHAYAQDFPTTALLHGTKETDSIVHFCDLKEGSVLECQFTQTRVSKKEKKLSAEEIRIRAENEYVEAKKEITSTKSCEFFKLLIDALEGKISFESAAAEGKKIGEVSDEQKFIEGFKSFSDLQKRMYLINFKAMHDFCENPTIDNYVKIITASNDAQTKTCTVGPNTYEQKFQYIEDYASQAGAWVAISNPSGPCGIINLSRFEKVQSSLGFEHWNYIAKKTITNPNGQALPNMSCNDFDETEYLYSWESKSHYLGCEIIEFSPF